MAASDGQGDDSVRVTEDGSRIQKLLPIGYLNGTFAKATEFRIHPLDRGFLYGDGVSEVFPAYANQLFRFDEHYERLERSLALSRIDNPLSLQAWRDIAMRLIEMNPVDELEVHVLVSRGLGALALNAPRPRRPSIFVYATTRFAGPDRGMRAVLLRDSRWGLGDIRGSARLAEALLRQEALERGADEGILVFGGKVTEAADANVFAVLDEFIVTPPLGRHVGDGVYRQLVGELIESASLPFVEAPLDEAQARAASELWLVGTRLEITPVVSLDGKPVGRGEPGQIWRKMRQRFESLRDESVGA